MAQQSFTRFFTELARVLAPLTETEDPLGFFQGLGWDIEALTGGTTTSFSSSLATLKQSAQIVQTWVASPPQTFAEFRTALGKLEAVQQAVRNLQGPLLANSAVAAALPGQLLGKLVVLYLRLYHPLAYNALSLLQLLHAEQTPSVIDPVTNALYYQAGQLPVLSLGRIKDFLSDPTGYLKAQYWPGGLPDQAAASQVAETLFPYLGELAHHLGLDFRYGRGDSPQPSYLTATQWEEFRSAATLSTPVFATATGSISLAMGLGLLPATAFAADGAGVYLVPQGLATLEDRFGNWLVSADLSAGAGGLRIHQHKISSLGTNAAAIKLHATLRPLRPSAQPAPAFVWGSPTGTRLEVGDYAVRAFLTTEGAGGDYGVQVAFQRLRLVLASADADSFLGKALKTTGGSPGIAFSLAVAWSKQKGLHLSGGAAGKLETRISLPKFGSQTTSLTFGELALGLQAKEDEDAIALYATTDAVIKLGPVVATIAKFGLNAALKQVENGNFGSFDASINFQAPSGVGIAVKSDFVNGGGYLYFDAPHHKYAGVANLRIKAGPKEINVNAIGLLQTQLPGHPDAYSLLLLLTATFGPIELGLGFKLSGLGGLVGVNRAADTNYLRTLVRTQKLDTLLFPADVMRDPAGAVALADSAFPARVGRHTIGLMAQLGWGVSGSLITLDVALLLEFPEPLTVIMLGVLQASLPSKANELLKLRADFLGYVDFGAKKAAFDATLSASKLLVYTLSGDMAFRLFQGDNPVFVITAGGFHPSFQPPAGAALTGLQRITLALAPSNDLRVTLASYYAVTSNTVQFGANLDLYYRLCRGLHVEGHFGFDVLFQFNPFALTAHVAAGVAIKNGDSELLSLHLSLDVTGPRPWHIWGEASFRIWFVKISVGVNATINGGSGSEPALMAPDVHTQLVQALAAPTSWEVETPKTAAQPGGVVLRPVAATAGQPFLDARGALVLRQHVAPFGLLLNKYGSGTSVPVHGRYFTLSELTLGKDAAARTYKLSDSPSLLEPVREFFAPDQFTALTDAQRLSVPSFQLLANGLRLKGLAGLTSTTQVTRRVVAYEQKLLDGTSGGHRLKVGAEQFRQLAKGGTLGQAVAAARPSARAPRPVGWAEDRYAVANAADLTAYAGHASFPTQVEAEQYRQAVVAAQPALAAEVLVVPSYELATA